MQILRPDDLSAEQMRSLFEEAIAPRPLAIVSTIGSYGLPYLQVLEWYSSACAYPPVQYFSVDPGADGSRAGQLLAELRATREFVLNGVDETLAPLLPLLETERDPSESDFFRAGLTAQPSVHVAAPRILESPTHLECRVLDVFPMGDCFVVLGAVLAFHVRDELFQDGKIEQTAYRAVGRLGAGAHCRSSELYLMQPSQAMSDAGLPVPEQGVTA